MVHFRVAALAAAVAAAASATAATAQNTIADLTRTHPEFTLLTRALSSTNLLPLIGNPASRLTVFAPTNAAFVSLAEALGYEGTNPTDAFNAIVATLTNLGGGDPIPTLSAILQYHVAAGELLASDVIAAGGYMPLLGPNVTLADDMMTLVDAAPAVADPKLVATDLEAINGVVHVIDGVLLPIAVGGVTPSPTPDEPACFPADATATLASGAAVRMDALAVGDAVAVGGGRFSDVFAFTHADAGAAAALVELTVASPAADSCAAHGRPLRLTPGHYLSVNGRLAAAATVAVGDTLVRADGSAAVVVRVASRVGRGCSTRRPSTGPFWSTASSRRPTRRRWSRGWRPPPSRRCARCTRSGRGG
eukprot:TRINITY_DN144_c0_g1_i4.p1 TRINITY_DN144_c0_g1~~TRINITY_DN144_c0_g1_i4.p1  ORF type:complete len:363 (-),score=139.67 TRINITY_DN144_c0_g1_i4:304-1392(-)